MSSALPEESAGNQTPVVGKVVQSPAGADAQQLRDEIERTREHLGETVEQLAARLDVKSRARAEAAELSARVKRAGSQARQAAPGYAQLALKKAREQAIPLSVAAAGVLVAVSWVIWRRRRH